MPFDGGEAGMKDYEAEVNPLHCFVAFILFIVFDEADEEDDRQRGCDVHHEGAQDDLKSVYDRVQLNHS